MVPIIALSYEFCQALIEVMLLKPKQKLANKESLEYALSVSLETIFYCMHFLTMFNGVATDHFIRVECCGVSAGMLMRPEYHEAKVEARKWEAKAEAKKYLARPRPTSMRPRP